MTRLTLKTEGDRRIVVKRSFAASPERVYRAHTEADIIRRWMTGPEGWTMVSCACDARAGGEFRYEWAHAQRGRFHITGEFAELVPFTRIVHVERMFLPGPTPDNHVETRFDAKGDGTLMTVTMTLPDEKTRAAMLATGMEDGMEASYARFDSEFAPATGDCPYAIVTVEPQPTAAVKFAAPFAALPDAERTGRAKIADAMPKLGVSAGLTCTLCRLLDGSRMHYEPGVIVDHAFESAGDVVCSQLPGGRAVKHLLSGSFDQLPQAWPALFAWCAENGLEREGSFWQVYGPTPDDAAQQQTVLYALLA